MAENQGSTSNEPTPAEKFAEEQKAAAQAQGLPDGAVPEQRPIASQVSSAPDSQTVQRMDEQGVNVAGADDSAMKKAAYDKAQSESRQKEAAKESRSETRFPTGTRVKVNKKDKINEGRIAVTTRIASFKSAADALKNLIGNEESRFAEVAEYEVEFKDGRNDRLVLPADTLDEITEREFLSGRVF